MTVDIHAMLCQPNPPWSWMQLGSWDQYDKHLSAAWRIPHVRRNGEQPREDDAWEHHSPPFQRIPREAPKNGVKVHGDARPATSGGPTHWAPPPGAHISFSQTAKLGQFHGKSSKGGDQVIQGIWLHLTVNYHLHFYPLS